MTCDGCVKDISDALYRLGGITKVEGNLKDQLISVEGTGMSLRCLAVAGRSGQVFRRQNE